LNSIELTRLEKAAADCGFELSPEMTGQGLMFRSAQFPESVTVQSQGNDVFTLHASEPLLLPTTAPEGHTVQGWSVLYQVLDKAAAIARTMPNRVADKYHQETAAMPKSTEAERWVVQRVGQDLFRSALLDFWQGRCCATGLAVPELLRASHIKPWAQCGSDEERLDVFNGLLLAPHLDALFDGGWMTVQPDGNVLFAKRMPALELQQLGVQRDLKVQGLTTTHERYLGFHRNSVFKD
jgi:hypothetical protein